MKFNWIKNCFKMFQFKKIAHKCEATEKGDCYIRYIINKYINNTKPDDFIQAYEDMITKREKAVLEHATFRLACTDENGEVSQEKVHFIAANLALGLILISLTEKEVDYYLNLIKNDMARSFIKILAHPDQALKGKI